MEDAIRDSHRADASNVRSATNLFLSYNRADRDVLLRIRQHLYARGISVFYDSENLLPGLPWVPALNQALNEVRAVAIFIGKAGLGHWQMHEVSYSLDRQTHEKDFPVIPVLLPGANIEALGFLKLNTWIDLRDNVDNPTTLNTLARAVSGPPFIDNLSDTIAPFTFPPYRALRPFREVDASLFFGREAFARALYKKVLEHRLVTLVGPSGSGKSSVVQAGLLPLLRRERPPSITWDIVVFRVGQHPFQSMAGAFIPLWERDESDLTDLVLKAGELGKSWAEGIPLTGAINQILKESSGTDRLIIVVDQFEELFAYVDCLQFVKAILDVGRSAPVTVILTLRADFYSQAISLDRELSDLIETGIINLGPMKRDELRAAIVRPAESVRVYFQDGMVERILDHVEEQPGHLPLLEFTLTELWERKQGNQITSEQYDIIGGVKGAISRRADALLASLPAERQQDALRMLTRLVRLTGASKDDAHTRQRVRLSDLGEEVLPLVRSFTDARLLVTSRDNLTGEDTVDLAHEALIHAWGTLTSYLEGDRQFLLWRQRLSFKIDEWDYSGSDRGLLLTGVPLAEAVHFAETRADELNEIELDFIYASERKVRTRHHWALALISVTVLTLLVGSLWVMWKRSDTYQIQTVLSRGSRLAAASRTGADDEWLSALIYYGRNDEAFDLAGGRISALAVITAALMKTGQVDEARKTADRVYTSASKGRP
jgi:hypothetical protein